jgi:hypothetical protein
MGPLLDGEVITAEKITRMVKGKVKSKVSSLVGALNNRLRSITGKEKDVPKITDTTKTLLSWTIYQLNVIISV